MLIDGISPVTEPVAAQRNLGALLDHAGLYERLTVRENLAYFGALRGLSPAVLDRRIDEGIDILDLKGLADRQVVRFSQGERMKTALGRAMIHDPGNIVLDEPTSGLDVLGVRSLRSLLTRLRDSGRCIIFSSHVLDEVRAVCDNVVIIANGSRAGEGSPQQLCRQTGSISLEDVFVKLANDREDVAC